MVRRRPAGAVVVRAAAVAAGARGVLAGVAVRVAAAVAAVRVVPAAGTAAVVAVTAAVAVPRSRTVRGRISSRT